MHIVHINDAHHFHLGTRPADANKEEPQKTLPIHALDQFLERKRQECIDRGDDLLYLSAGDEHTGTSLDELLGYSPEQFRMSAGYAFQSLLGLDAAAIGNHDLDRGSRILREAARQSASFPILSANIADSEFLTERVAAIVGETSGGISVGIVGLTTDAQITVPRSLDSAFRIGDPIEAALRWYGRLAPVVEVLIMLSHLGLNVDGSRHQSKRDDRFLARAIAREESSTLPGKVPVVLIIGGHTHTLIDPESKPVVVDGIPIFQAGCNMEHVGEVRVEPRYRTIEGKLISLAPSGGEAPLSEEIAIHAQKAVTALSEAVLRPVVTIGRADDVDVTTTLEDRLTGECAVADMITDALYDRCRTSEHSIVIVACDASGIQSGITEDNRKKGILCIDDFYRILPYADSLFRAVVTPDDLEEIVQSNSRRVLPRRLLETQGGDIGPMDWSKIARGFLHFSWNLRYRIEENREGNRASGITIDNVPLEELPPQTSIALYCNSFSAMGNQGWSVDEESFGEFGSVSLSELPFSDTTIPLRIALIESLSGKKHLTLGRDGRLIIDGK